MAQAKAGNRQAKEEWEHLGLEMFNLLFATRSVISVATTAIAIITKTTMMISILPSRQKKDQ